MRPRDIRRIPQRQALIIAGSAPPIIAKLSRCIDGPAGQKLKAEQASLREQVGAARQNKPDIIRRTAHAVAYSRTNLLTPGDPAVDEQAGAAAGTAGGSKEWPWG